MSYGDWYLNYATLYLCRFFDSEWTEIYIDSEFSIANATAGGCTNFDSCSFNPQMKLIVEAKDSGRPVEAFIQLSL